ncbi:hypothetical protein [Psychrobacillus sp. MER TA 171]|uniref:hypothetical protein n=1 Tax=Psychrobacillus sp. MER TA 171 TaxID=2939577 RepID=UPI002040493D|nr:hypothetical protein [Psychrobacillus sp. MER TA 171]MCM3358079.1 hypothetical protein [Psychrobacillus sp. MER TA 171]
MYPPVISTKLGNYVRITRIANEGFNIKPYKKEGVYKHTERFIDTTIDELNDQVKNLDKSKYIIPELEENLMEGCFCFLYHFDIRQAEHNGNLSHRMFDKLNVAYLHENENVWVKNVNITGEKDNRLIKITKESKNPFTGEIPTIEDNVRKVSDWVKMPLFLAVQRTNKNKQIRKLKNQRILEDISQMYLMDSQVLRRTRTILRLSK